MRHAYYNAKSERAAYVGSSQRTQCLDTITVGPQAALLVRVSIPSAQSKSQSDMQIQKGVQSSVRVSKFFLQNRGTTFPN